MNPEIIALLNARSPDTRMLPKGYGSITQADIAHAIGLVHGTGPQLLGRVLYAQQAQWATHIATELYSRLYKHAKRSGWKNIKPLYNLSKLSISLYTNPKRCTQCKGIGQRLISNKVYVCQKCNGSTWNVTRPAEMARVIGVSKVAWANTWDRRLLKANEILSGWEKDFLVDVGKTMKTP